MSSAKTHTDVMLLPCPFCGGPAYIDVTSPGMDIDTPAWYCGCRSCSYTLGSFRISTWNQQSGWTPDPQAQRKAMNLWNRRIIP